jgi:ribose transport system permease protein
MNDTDVTKNISNNQKKRIRISPPAIAMIIAVLLFLLSGLLPAGYSTFQGAIRQGLNILRLASFIAIIGAGQTLVIISGGEGIDLSAGPIVTIGALLTYMIINGQNQMILPVLLLVIAIGSIIGLFNGLGITYLKISPFVMTLVMAGVVQGALILWTKGYYDGRVAPIMTQIAARDLFWGIPGMIFIWILIGILMTLLIRTHSLW